jgi:hypothetical protein
VSITAYTQYSRIQTFGGTHQIGKRSDLHFWHYTGSMYLNRLLDSPQFDGYLLIWRAGDDPYRQPYLLNGKAFKHLETVDAGHLKVYHEAIELPKSIAGKQIKAKGTMQMLN